MSKIYTTSADFINIELGNLITAASGLRADFDTAELFDRLVTAGLVEWHDAYDADRNVYLLDQQGYRWVTDEDGVMDEALFWDLVQAEGEKRGSLSIEEN